MNGWDYFAIGAVSGLVTVVLGGISLFFLKNRLLRTFEQVIDTYLGKVFAHMQAEPEYYTAILKPILNKVVSDVGGSAIQKAMPKFKIMDVVGAVAMGFIMPRLGPMLSGFAGETAGKVIDAVAETPQKNPFK